MAIVLVNTSINVNAKSLKDNKDDLLEFVEISDQEMEAEEIGGDTVNVLPNNINRSLTNDYNGIIRGGEKLEELENDDFDPNTDPNNAYLVSNDTITQGTVEESDEMRWYAFILNQTSKITILLQMVDTLDADLYIYKLDEQTYDL